MCVYYVTVMTTWKHDKNEKNMNTWQIISSCSNKSWETPSVTMSKSTAISRNKLKSINILTTNLITW